MVTKINNFYLLLLSVLLLSSCSEEFMKEKKNFDNVNEGIYDYTEGCEGRLNEMPTSAPSRQRNIPASATLLIRR